MSVAPDHFPNISFAHLDFEDHLAALIHLAHKHFFRSPDKLPDDVLKKTLHWNLCGWTGGRILLPSFQNHARNGGTWLGTALHPVVRTIQIKTEILARSPRVVFSDRLYEFSVARTSFVRYHHTIKRAVLGSFSP
jgi:hypothetical protein